MTVDANRRHPLLKRQLRKSGLNDEPPTLTKWTTLLAKIDRSYRISDRRLHDLESDLNETISALRQATVGSEAAVGSESDGETTKAAPLTGLVNRALMARKIEAALVEAGTTNEWPSLLLVDLDRFKQVNDRLGHSAGDQLLELAASRIVSSVRDVDIVSRLGGDEFVVLCAGSADAALVGACADRILAAINEPFNIGGELLNVSASIGMASAGPSHTTDALLHDADLAMYRAKDRGRNCVDVADEALRENMAERNLLETALRSALVDGGVSAAYQPIQDLATGELIGLEALARWVHPVLGDVRPNRFVPIAEAVGLIQALGDRMFDLACQDVATWNRERKALGLTPVSVHVNISGRELQSPGLLGRVRDAMRRHSVLPSWVVLEMTETMLLDDPELAIERLRELKLAGIRVAIDDFGTGYSSFSYLRRFPVHMIKIDRVFIAELAASKQDQSIVKAMVELAAGLECTVTAEGVETRAELEALRKLGCKFAQGYLLGSPVPGEDALLLATSSQTRIRDLAPSASAETEHLQPQP